MSGDIEPGTILFVDDEANILRSLQRLFIPLGYEVFTAESGQAGLDLLASNSVDIIISDMRMPEMDGAEFLKQVAQQYPSTKRMLLTGYSDLESAISAVNHGKIDYYLNKPWKDNQLEVAVQNALESKRLKEKNTQLESEVLEKNEKLKQLNASLEEKVLARTAELKRAHDILKKSNQSLIEVLSTVVEMHEGEQRGQCRSIAEIAQATAEAVGLPDEEVQQIYFASLLHNIGKIGMPESLLTKAYIKMTPLELKQYKQYPLLGEAALMAFESLKDVAHIILTHREYFNGSGYPNQLKQEAIPMGARIVALAVDYVNLQQGLVVDEQLVATQALELMEKNRGKHYDPDMFDIFMGCD